MGIIYEREDIPMIVGYHYVIHVSRLLIWNIIRQVSTHSSDGKCFDSFKAKLSLLYRSNQQKKMPKTLQFAGFNSKWHIKKGLCSRYAAPLHPSAAVVMKLRSFATFTLGVQSMPREEKCYQKNSKFGQAPLCNTKIICTASDAQQKANITKLFSGEKVSQAFKVSKPSCTKRCVCSGWNKGACSWTLASCTLSCHVVIVIHFFIIPLCLQLDDVKQDSISSQLSMCTSSSLYRGHESRVQWRRPPPARSCCD